MDIVRSELSGPMRVAKFLAWLSDYFSDFPAMQADLKRKKNFL
jgi:hypothetical protein